MPTIKTKDGLELHLHPFPKDKAKAAVVIAHGYGEHGGRYQELARTLNEGGYDVLGYDQRGHGRSGGKRGYCDVFSQYLDDFELVLAESERQAPSLPRLVVAHSFGGLVATMAVLDRRPKLAGVVLSSPFFRVKLQVPGWKIVAARAASVVYPALALPSGLSGAQCTRDPDLAVKYDADPLNNKNATARWFTESMLAQERVFNEASAFELPLLLMHGEADVVADPVRSAEVFPRIGSRDKTLELVSGAFHEIFNEPPPDRKRLMARTVSWMDTHLAPQSAAQASG